MPGIMQQSALHEWVDHLSDCPDCAQVEAGALRMYCAKGDRYRAALSSPELAAWARASARVQAIAVARSMVLR